MIWNCLMQWVLTPSLRGDIWFFVVCSFFLSCFFSPSLHVWLKKGKTLWYNLAICSTQTYQPKPIVATPTKYKEASNNLLGVLAQFWLDWEQTEFMFTMWSLAHYERGSNCYSWSYNSSYLVQLKNKDMSKWNSSVIGVVYDSSSCLIGCKCIWIL